MTQGKGKRDEKLIEELYEKLYWYTYEASEEEFDDKEVDAIVRLLDVLDPKEDDPKFPSDPGAAFDRFKSRYGLLRSAGYSNSAEHGKICEDFCRFLKGKPSSRYPYYKRSS